MQLDKEYWDEQYRQGRTGWDIGYVSTPIKEYIDQLKDKEMRILVPGAGNAWEVEYLFKNGFRNVYLLDFSENAVAQFKQRLPDFPEENILIEDFFHHQGSYDLILEQTFFTSFLPDQRKEYCRKMHELLKSEGKLVGLLFNHEFEYQGPPFSATPETYKKIFTPYFELKIFETANNSIKPRKGRELFVIMKKREV